THALQREFGVAVAAPGHHHDLGSKFASSLPVWRGFSQPAPTNRSGETGLGRATYPAGHKGESGSMASLRRSGIRLLLRLERLSEGLGSVPRRKQEPRSACVDESDGCPDCGGGRVLRDFCFSLE